MTYQSLYRKYRPQRFEDVVGQESIVTALTNAIRTHKLSHAYLFTGPRGTGKTTMAKLLANAINCENPEQLICGVCDNCQQANLGNHPDIVEIDAASNNSVDDIRGLIERVKFAPILGKYKVYIIDEVHMLSMAAFNALLKTLEEPPEHIVFILATTEIHKVLPTIISRCQRYDFSRIGITDISGMLEKVVQKENRTMEMGASSLIASLSAGGMRNALTILEQSMVFNEGTITRKSIYDYNGMVLPSEKILLFKNLSNPNIEELLNVVNTVLEKSVDIQRLIMDLVTGLKDSLVFKYTNNQDFININDIDYIEYIAETYNSKEIIGFMDLLLSYNDKIKFSSNQRAYFEIAFMELYEKTEKIEVSEETKEDTFEGTEVEYTENELRSVDVEATPITQLDYEDSVGEEIDVFEAPIDEDNEEVPQLNFDLNGPEISDEEEAELFSNEVIEEEVPQLNFDLDEPEINQVETQLLNDEVLKEEILEEPIQKEEVVEESPLVDYEEKEELEALDDNVVPEPAENPLDLDLNEIVQLMVSADKEIRFQDENLFTGIKGYLSDLKWAREAKLLNNTQIVLSGERFILVATRSQVQAREIQEENNMYFLLSFTEELLGTQKQVFAAPSDQFKRAIELFKDLSVSNRLPKPFDSDDFVTLNEEEEQDTRTEMVRDLFGSVVEIKE